MTTQPPPDIRQHFGANLAAIRKRRQIPFREMGERANVPYSSIVSYESGDTVPELGTILKIAAALNVAPGDLLTEPAPRPWFDFEAIREAFWEGYHSAIDADPEHPAGQGDDLRNADAYGMIAVTAEVLDQLIERIAPTEPNPERIGWIREIRRSLDG